MRTGANDIILAAALLGGLSGGCNLDILNGRPDREYGDEAPSHTGGDHHPAGDTVGGDPGVAGDSLGGGDDLRLGDAAGSGDAGENGDSIDPGDTLPGGDSIDPGDTLPGGDDIGPGDGCNAALPAELNASWEGCGPYDVVVSWSGGAAAYDLEIENDIGFSTNLSTATPSHTFSAAAAATYTWRVRVSDSACAWVEGPAVHIAAGRTWSSIAPTPPTFPGREGHGAVVDGDGTLWVFGGDAAGDTNDVWSSSDGVSWTEVNTAADFSARRWFASTFFDGRMWLIGGNLGTGDTAQSDVWFSYDGDTWVPAATDAFAGRHSPTVVPFNDELFLIGGEGPNCNTRRDVWSSSDGYSWTEQTNAAAFDSRDWHASVVFRDRIWVIGGIHRSSACAVTYLDDVWSSADGSDWILETAGAFPSRGGHSAVVLDEKIWVVGGTNAWPAASQSDVWYSSDGVTWCQATDTHDFSNRYGQAAVVKNDQLWIVGGFDGVHQDDIWVSD